MIYLITLLWLDIYIFIDLLKPTEPKGNQGFRMNQFKNENLVDHHGKYYNVAQKIWVLLA